jgi:hypothetical protein
VEGLEGAHLVLGDALGAFEVVDVDVAVSGGSSGCAAAGSAEDVRAAFTAGGFVHLSGIDGGEKGIDFGLIQDVAQGAASVPLSGIIGP